MLEFVVPATPVLRALPPRGPDWLHEAKFDGWRIQLHKDGSVVRLYTKSGYDCTRRFGVLCSALAAVPARACIIDGEVTAFDPLGLLDFNALHFRTAEDDDIAVWASICCSMTAGTCATCRLSSARTCSWSSHGCG